MGRSYAFETLSDFGPIFPRPPDRPKRLLPTSGFRPTAEALTTPPRSRKALVGRAPRSLRACSLHRSASALVPIWTNESCDGQMSATAVATQVHEPPKTLSLAMRRVRRRSTRTFLEDPSKPTSRVHFTHIQQIILQAIWKVFLHIGRRIRPTMVKLGGRLVHVTPTFLFRGR